MSSWIKESKSRWIVCKIIITAANNARCMFTSNISGTMFSASSLILLLLHLVTWLLEWRSGRMELDFGVQWRGLEGEGGANLCVWFNLYMSGCLFMSVCYFSSLSIFVCVPVCVWWWIEVGRSREAWEETAAPTFYPNLPPLTLSQPSRRALTESHTFLHTPCNVVYWLVYTLTQYHGLYCYQE